MDRAHWIGMGGEERSLEVIRGYLAKCKNLGVHEVIAVGTSALRDARNAGDFKDRLKRELGLELHVLSGEEEAAYSYLAVQKGLTLEGTEVLVVDVGGGSTELIWATEGSSYRSISLNLGSVRLTERFLHSDPVRDSEISQVRKAIDRELEPVIAEWRTDYRSPTIVGIAGTFTTLAAVEKGLKMYSHREVHGCWLRRLEVQRQIRLFKGKTIAERKEIAGLEPKRADVILAGALLIDRVMGFFGVGQVIVSDHGIRYGLLQERLLAPNG